MTRACEQGRLLFWLLVVRLALCDHQGSDAFRLIKEVVKLNAVLDSVFPDEGHIIPVNLTFFPINVIALHEREQRFSVSGWFHITWYGPLLEWNPADYGNISRIYVAHDQIWKPDLTVINGAENLPSVSGSDTALVLSADGRVDWFPGNVFSATCKMDLSSFPFDKQDCFIQVSTWVYTAETVLLHPLKTPIRRDSWHENSEWDLQEISLKSYIKSSNGRLYPYVEYHFHLKRRSTFYVLKFLAPIVLLSLVNAFVFCVPPESGEKVSLAVSTMLSLTVFLAYLTDFTPSNSDTVPEVALFVFLHLALGACGATTNILLLKLHFYHLHTSQKSHRKRTEKLWTTSVEEQDDPAAAGHRKNTTQSYWTSDIDEEVDDEALEGSAAKLGPKSDILNSRLFCRDSSVSEQDRVFRPRPTGTSSRGFSDITRDRYYTFQTNNRTRKGRNGSQHNNTSSNSNNSQDRKNAVSGRRFGRYNLTTDSWKRNLLSCFVKHLGRVCFVVYFILSVLVSAVFFLRNV